jgi:hypothetical protein
MSEGPPRQMPSNTHGGFDQVVEIGNAFFKNQAAASFNLAAVPVQSAPGDAFTYAGSVRPTLRDVWLGDAGEIFDPVTSQWQAANQVAAWNAVVLGIDISGSIEIKSIQVTTPGGQTMDLPVPSTVRTLRVHVGVVILAPLGVENLATRNARDEKFSSTRLPCAVVILPTSTFFYNVKVGMGNRALPYAQQPRQSVRGSPFVDWAIDAINTLKRLGIADLGDPEVVVVEKIEQTLRDTVTTTIRDTLNKTCDWRLKAQRRLGLVMSTPEMGVQRLEARTTFSSIRVFMQTTGPGGQAQLATRSQLRPGAGDDVAITVNGRYFLERLRKPLQDALGVSPADFLPGEPCTIASPVTITLGGSSVTLRYLQAGVDESSSLILWLFLRQNLPLGATVDIEVEVPITFGAQRAISGTEQIVLLTPSLGPALVAASADTVPVVHWILAEIARGKVAGAVSALAGLPPEEVPAPSQTFFVVPNNVSLNQAGAPRPDRTWPGMRLIGGDFLVGVVSEPPGLHAARFREHDLVLRLGAFRSYPSPLTISCVAHDASDELRRIDGVGGSLPANYPPGPGSPWALSVDAAIDWVASGRGLRTTDGTTVILGRPPDDCPPDDSDNRRIPFLRTTGDTTTSNNLATTPPCPSGVRM